MIKTYLRFRTEEQLQEAMAWEHPCTWLADAALYEKHPDLCGRGHMVYVVLPDVMREAAAERVRKLAQSLPSGAGLVAGNLDALGLLSEIGWQGPLIGDSFLYAFNREAVDLYLSLFAQMEFLCSDELTDRELSGFADPERFIYKVYGHQQLMVSEQCISRNYTDCREKCLRFRDERGESFYAVSDCVSCNSRIYNGLPTYMLDKTGQIPYEKRLLDFTVEDGADMRAILALYARGSATVPEKLRITRGHHYTGVD